MTPRTALVISFIALLAAVYGFKEKDKRIAVKLERNLCEVQVRQVKATALLSCRTEFIEQMIHDQDNITMQIEGKCRRVGQL